MYAVPHTSDNWFVLRVILDNKDSASNCRYANALCYNPDMMNKRTKWKGRRLTVGLDLHERRFVASAAIEGHDPEQMARLLGMLLDIIDRAAAPSPVSSWKLVS